ncbi:MAG: hypothetical protein RLZZ117_2388, partial [Cyanobacteriota bacterium]
MFCGSASFLVRRWMMEPPWGPMASASQNPEPPLTMTNLRTPLLEAELAVDALADSARNHRAVCHPYLAALAEGSLPNPSRALADFAHHYMGYAAHFPRYLTALISRLDHPDHRQALLANLLEETGQYAPSELATLAECGIQEDWILGVPHPELFRRFHRAVNGADAAGAGEQLEVVCWREMLLAVISLGSAAEAVGALGLGTEAIVP